MINIVYIVLSKNKMGYFSEILLQIKIVSFMKLDFIWFKLLVKAARLRCLRSQDFDYQFNVFYLFIVNLSECFCSKHFFLKWYNI